MAHMTLLPAYDRDYSSRAEAVADWLADKDFEDASWDASGRYVNRPQVADGVTVTLRFKRATQCAVFRKGSEPKPRKRGEGKARPRGYRVRVQGPLGGYKRDAFRTKAEAIRWARRASDATPGVGFGMDETLGTPLVSSVFELHAPMAPGGKPMPTSGRYSFVRLVPSDTPVAQFRAGRPVK